MIFDVWIKVWFSVLFSSEDTICIACEVGVVNLVILIFLEGLVMGLCVVNSIMIIGKY